MIRDDLKKSGYNKEEEYFTKLNQELIQRRREELDRARKQQQLQQATATHWMRCPKCGLAMKEVDLSGIKADRCTGCLGIYFDQGELETLLQSREPVGFFHTLKRLFHR